MSKLTKVFLSCLVVCASCFLFIGVLPDLNQSSSTPRSDNFTGSDGDTPSSGTLVPADTLVSAGKDFSFLGVLFVLRTGAHPEVESLVVQPVVIPMIDVVARIGVCNNHMHVDGCGLVTGSDRTPGIERIRMFGPTRLPFVLAQNFEDVVVNDGDLSLRQRDEFRHRTNMPPKGEV